MLMHIITLVSSRLFRKNLGNLREFFGQMVHRPPGKKIARTPMLVTRYSLLVTRYSLLVTRYSLLVTRYSLLVTRYSLLVTALLCLVTPTNQQTRLSYKTAPQLAGSNRSQTMSIQRMSSNTTWSYLACEENGAEITCGL